MKNHLKINGRLLQTNKKWSQLKEKQKQYIYDIIKDKYNTFRVKNSRIPNKVEKQTILNEVYSMIEDKGIWIPYSEVNKFFHSKLNKLNSKEDVI